MHEFGELEAFLVQRSLVLRGSAKDLMKALRRQLLAASDRRRIVTPPQHIHKYLDLPCQLRPNLMADLRAAGLARRAFVVTGGEKNRERSSERHHFKRTDDAWFDFSIVGCESSGHVEILSYNYEIRLPIGYGSPFIRFDLNLPGHGSRDELRCHAHIGSDNVRVPAPLMTPHEMLTLFIDGICPAFPEEPRTRTVFEREWFAQSHGMLDVGSRREG